MKPLAAILVVLFILPGSAAAAARQPSLTRVDEASARWTKEIQGGTAKDYSYIELSARRLSDPDTGRVQTLKVMLTKGSCIENNPDSVLCIPKVQVTKSVPARAFSTDGHLEQARLNVRIGGSVATVSWSTDPLAPTDHYQWASDSPCSQTPLPLTRHGEGVGKTGDAGGKVFGQRTAPWRVDRSETYLEVGYIIDPC